MHPELGIPFSDRRLVECMREGAKRFGWDKRPRAPASVRDGRKLVGYGMAAAIRPHFQGMTTVRVRLEPDGGAVVESDMTDLGTGTYTILAQVVADKLGLAVERVRVELGRSEFPASSGSGGSWGATNSTNAAANACDALRAQGMPVGVNVEGSVRNEWDEPDFGKYSKSSYGAHFAEVHVDIDTAEVRLVRMLGVFDPGRVLNAKTARSQLIGGMIWGVSGALHEEGVVDPRFGSFINRDFAQYLVPVQADIREIEAIVIDSFDDKANPLGAKGIGELGICGSGAAIGNAVFNATGIRVREFPITIEKLLARLPR
jgi:xanthine dehydrogenase YagR molybdenum-binding subunit